MTSWEYFDHEDDETTTETEKSNVNKVLRNELSVRDDKISELNTYLREKEKLISELFVELQHKTGHISKLMYDMRSRSILQAELKHRINVMENELKTIHQTLVQSGNIKSKKQWFKSMSKLHSKSDFFYNPFQFPIFDDSFRAFPNNSFLTGRIVRRCNSSNVHGSVEDARKIYR